MPFTGAIKTNGLKALARRLIIHFTVCNFHCICVAGLLSESCFKSNKKSFSIIQETWNFKWSFRFIYVTPVQILVHSLSSTAFALSSYWSFTACSVPFVAPYLQSALSQSSQKTFLLLLKCEILAVVRAWSGEAAALLDIVFQFHTKQLTAVPMYR